ncbi:hypothetical protein IHE45_09G021700 [Dioscorea alata]|uniref:Uncharacterized protein n=1 Tax=Dioscorea alata TaxID=55571 RepID=A0ACB7VE15_DIOAL|nr:hypothetical protein IHE45_09G021700 [Dioscorea alata]
MEKSRSFPKYSSSYSGRFGYEEHAKSYSFNGPSGKHEGFASSGDPELKRKRRIASYNMFAMEGKLKSSFLTGFKWIKTKFSDARNGGAGGV